MASGDSRSVKLASDQATPDASLAQPPTTARKTLLSAGLKGAGALAAATLLIDKAILPVEASSQSTLGPTAFASSGSAPAVSAANTTGPAIAASNQSTTSVTAGFVADGYCAVFASNKGTGNAIVATNQSSVSATAVITANGWLALGVNNQGTGGAIVATNQSAVTPTAVLQNTGGGAPVRLAASTQATHPATGVAGDLFLDAYSNLWLCKGGSVWRLIG